MFALKTQCTFLSNLKLSTVFNMNWIVLNLIHEYVRYKWIKFRAGECEPGNRVECMK